MGKTLLIFKLMEVLLLASLGYFFALSVRGIIEEMWWSHTHSCNLPSVK